MMNRLGTRIITSTSPRTFVRTTDILCNLPPAPCTKTKTKLVNLPEESIAFCLFLYCDCCCCDSPDVLCGQLVLTLVSPVPSDPSPWGSSSTNPLLLLPGHHLDFFKRIAAQTKKIGQTFTFSTPATEPSSPHAHTPPKPRTIRLHEPTTLRNLTKPSETLHLARRRDDLLRPSLWWSVYLSLLYSDLKH